MPQLSSAHPRFVDGNLYQPSAKCRLSTKLLKTRQGFEQSILRYVFSVFFASEHGNDGRVYRALIRTDQLKEQVLLTRQNSAYQNLFGGSFPSFEAVFSAPTPVGHEGTAFSSDPPPPNP